MALYRKIYEFAVSRMYKSRADAEAFASLWLKEHANVDFTRFEELYDFAVNTMYKSRRDAEAFALGKIEGGS